MIETRYEIRDSLSKDTREVFTLHSRDFMSSEFKYVSTYCFNCTKWKVKPSGICLTAYHCNRCNKENPLFFMSNRWQQTVVHTKDYRREYLPRFVLLEKFITEKIPIERITSVILATQYRESFIVCPLPEQRAVVYWL